MATNQNKINVDNVNSGEIPQQRIKNSSYCPQTGKLVANLGYQTFLLPDGQAIWWHCPACRGWHVIMQT